MSTRRNSNVKLGPFNFVVGGVTAVGLLIVAAALYGASALFWGWVFMLIHGAVVGSGTPGYWTEAWSLHQALIPWGLLAPFVLG